MKVATRRYGDNAGQGSAGSRREPDVDTTRHGDHDAAALKAGGDHHHRTPLIIRRETNGNLRPMQFVSLHHHSTFSYLDGYQLPDAHVRRAVELNMGSFALTEHGNIDSHVKFEKAAAKEGVRPLFGCEVYMPSGPDWYRDDCQTQRKHHLTLIAQTPVGYTNLLKLVSDSWLNFYYDPMVTWNSLCRYKEGLIVLSGCQGSLLFCSTVGGKGIPEEEASYRRGLRIARAFKAEFGANYFIEVQAFPELAKTNEFNPIAARLAKAIGAKLVGDMDVHYTLLEEAEVQQILHNLRPGEKRTLEEQAREWGYDVPLCPPPSDRAIWRRLQLTGLDARQAMEAVLTTEEIAASIRVELPKLPMVRFPLPDGWDSAIDYWRHLMQAGWEYRRCDRWDREKRVKAKAQLRHEMSLIESKDFVDYFLLVRAGVVYMKDQDIPVGPARGSAAASIAAWLLRITEVCPLDFPYLRFDRFISVDREDLPDIDLDFPGDSRPILRRFYEDMLGPGCVANVGTFGQFKGKNSLDDVARVFRIPKFEVERLKDFLIERSSGDLRASSTIEDTIDQFEAAREIWERHPELAKASLLEGNVKSFGVHAAGIILANEPITSVTSLLEKESPRGSGNWIQVVAMDKKDAERQGMVKMDYLGLNTMSMLWECCRRLGVPITFLYSIPLDDPEVYEMLQAGDFVGVFQFDGRANRYVGNAVRPDQFSEIMDCIALCRPGPLHNGGARSYAEAKHGTGRIEVPHPAVADVTALTKYQIIYQEQVLDICRIVGGFDQVGVSDARRIIAKKEGEQAFSRMKDLFLEGVATLHKRTDYPEMAESQGRETFGDLITSGAYAFNAAHSAAYGLISVWTAWWKRYHPDIFYAASLTQAVRDESRTHQLLRDADRHGARIFPPDPQRSEAGWTPVRAGKTSGLLDVKRRVTTMRAGFQQIEGIGEKTAPIIAQYRADHGLKDWDDLINVRGIGPKTIERIREWVEMEDPLGAFTLVKNIAQVRQDILDGKLGEVPYPTHSAVDLPVEQGAQIEVVWLGTFVDRNIRDIFEQNQARTGEALDPSKVRDPHLNEWAQLTGEDETDQLLLKVDRWRYPRFKLALFDFRMGHDLLLVTGVRPRYASSRQIKVKHLYVIEP